jgi:transcriptional regulator with XRE-family HTH domain
MASSKLANYLRTHRRRLGLSQADVSFLLGGRDRNKACRYEKSVHKPSLETALAYEAIFQRPASELFGGLYQKIEADVAARAKMLASSEDHRPSPKTSRKRQIFTNMAARQSNYTN